MDTDDKVVANTAPVTGITEDTSESDNPSLMALLASALSLVGDNDTIKDLIAKDLNTSAFL